MKVHPYFLFTEQVVGKGDRLIMACDDGNMIGWSVSETDMSNGRKMAIKVGGSSGQACFHMRAVTWTHGFSVWRCCQRQRDLGTNWRTVFFLLASLNALYLTRVSCQQAVSRKGLYFEGSKPERS